MPSCFIPRGNISYGKLAQALEYGALTLQIDANFDRILALVRTLADRAGIYLLNSINPFRIEGQKSIIFELLDQRDWNSPDWIVLPGGNLGNTSAFGKVLRELRDFGFIRKMPRLAVVQAEGAAPFYEYMHARGEFRSVKEPHTLATAIKIGDPVSWPKALREVRESNGMVEKVSEQEIADVEGHHRTLWHRMRAGFRGHACGHSQAHSLRSNSLERRRSCSINGKCLKRPGLHLSISHGSTKRSRRKTD